MNSGGQPRQIRAGGASIRVYREPRPPVSKAAETSRVYASLKAALRGAAAVYVWMDEAGGLHTTTGDAIAAGLNVVGLYTENVGIDQLRGDVEAAR